VSDNIDFLLRKAIRSGLNYLSLSPNDANPNAGKWTSAYRHVDNSNCQYVDDDDPLEALAKAIRAGEREAKARREHAENVTIPLAEHTEKVRRKNATKVIADEAAQAKRRREREDLA
jgi:hypothetical protein